MSGVESAAFNAGIIALGLSLVFAIWSLIARAPGSRTGGYLNLAMIIVSFAAITISLVARAVNTGHGPFSSMYEFALAFSWGILVMGLFFRWSYKLPIVSMIGGLIAFGLMLFARSLSAQAAPLVPALQQSLLLTTHVASAVISYGAFTIGFVAAILYLFQSKSKNADVLDQISYRSLIVGFPFLTLVIVLGALWADVAWGKYWSWDPKETASLVTWLLYAAYLHARVMRGWRGKRAAILLIVGFCAVLVTFFGNYVFAGLHSYR